MPIVEYMLVDINRINEAAAEGWHVVPGIMIQEVKEGLSGSVGIVRLLIERPVSPDGAEA